MSIDHPKPSANLPGSDSVAVSGEKRLIGDRYELLSPLGNGAMGFVYQGIDRRLNRGVAIKVLSAEADIDEESRQRFEAEAKLASTFSHPNVAAVYDYGIDENKTPYIVMEFVDGEGLDALLKVRTKLRPQDVTVVFKQIAEGLHHAHKRGIIHRDLKPGNIIVSKNDADELVAKLVDFGLAKAVFADKNARITKTGEVLGTPLYMSPEQITGQELDARSDIYSLGIVMFECLTGRVPFRGKDAMATAQQHVSSQTPALGLEDTMENRQLETVVRHCLEKKKSDRFETALEVADALQLVMDKESLPTSHRLQAISAKLPSLARGAASPAPVAIALLLLAAACIVFACGFLLAEGMKSKPAAGQTEQTTQSR